MEAEKRYVYCKKCQAVVGEESDEALIMKTAYVESQFTFSCVACHTKNEWKSENSVLREQITQLNSKISSMEAAALLVKADYDKYKLMVENLVAELTSTKLALADCQKKIKK